MAGFSGNEALLGFSKQSAKGTLGASIEWVTPFTGGDIDFDRQVSRFDETSGTRETGASYVQLVDVKGAPAFFLRPDNCVGIFEGALGSRAAVTGSGPYVRVITPIDTQLPYFSFWQALGGSSSGAPNVLVNAFRDCVIDSLQVHGGVGLPLECTTSIMGLTGVTNPTVKPTAPTLLTPFVYPQVTISKGGSGKTSVNDFTWQIDNAHTMQQGNGSLAAYDVDPGERKITGSMQILFESIADYSNYHFNSASPSANTAPNAAVFSEALSFTATQSSSAIVVISMPSVVYTSVKVMPDKSGAAIVAQYTYEGEPNASPITTVTVTNSVALDTAYVGV